MLEMREHQIQRSPLLSFSNPPILLWWPMASLCIHQEEEEEKSEHLSFLFLLFLCFASFVSVAACGEMVGKKERRGVALWVLAIGGEGEGEGRGIRDRSEPISCVPRRIVSVTHEKF